MPWCPNCKNEYKEGYTVCADCGATLVDHLEDDNREEESISPELAAALKAAAEEEKEEKEETEVRHYEDPGRKADEYRTGAFSLLLVGFAGLVLVILIQLGVINLSATGLNLKLISIVMGALFLIFIVAGFSSLKSFRKIEKQGESEELRKDSVRKYLLENWDMESVDRDIREEGISDEILYFKRIERLRKILKEHDETLEDGFIDYMIEELYPEIFEKQ